MLSPRERGPPGRVLSLAECPGVPALKFLIIFKLGAYNFILHWTLHITSG